jgi:predicted Zn finger-like uncharacterized protein
MKIVCDACQAKYSISDDKVQGKVFKIRCKKCSNIIVVRGGGGGAEAAPAPAQEKETRVYDYGYEGGAGGGGGDEAVWHLVINQDQVGPMTAAEVQQKFTSGEVDAETFTWREGFADWLPLAQVDAFTAFVTSGGATMNARGGGGAAAVSNMFGGGGGGDEAGTMRSDPGDLFAAASSTASRGHDDDDGNDLFGSKPAAAAQQASAAGAGGTKLRGERNENSVLFSLNNLAQLASDKPAPAAAKGPSMSSAPAGHATGAAGGEGSGLIDIRSMANAYLGAQPGGMAKPASAGVGSIDDLPVFGGGGFSEPAVLVPSATAARGNNKVLYVMIGAVGFLAVAAVIMVVILLKNNKSSTTPAAQVASAGTGSGATGDMAMADKNKPDGTGTVGGAAGSGTTEKAPDSPTAGSATTGTDTPPTPPTTTEKTETPKTVEKTETPKNTTTHRTNGGNTTTTTHRDPPPPRDTTPPPPKDTGGGSCDEVSCVLNNYEGACCAKFKKGPKGGSSGGSTSAPKSDLPDALDRAMISSGVANVKGRVTACGDKSSAKGKVKVHVKVGPDGRVVGGGVSVETTPDPALGACVASAMQKATFAKTQSGGSFSYPFVF